MGMSRKALTTARIIERVHLVFLQVLQARLDQTRYVVKGGVNLRYFFASPRYSEDVDLDAIDIDPWVLEEKVDKLLLSPATDSLLQAGGLGVRGTSKPKQTETTQRWRVLVDVTGRRDPVRTKIEFSHRGADPRQILEAVPERIVAPYGVRPPTMRHYLASAAIEQKIIALALRTETQARDLFDLELLFRTQPGAKDHRTLAPSTLADAAERASMLPFEAFQTQVLPFLDPDLAELHDRPETWRQLRDFVVEQLTPNA